MRELLVGSSTYRYHPLDELLTAAELARLPYTVRILLENVARRSPEAVPAVLGKGEIPFYPNRIMLHDTTCLPALADFAAVRDSVAELGGDPERIQPSIPVDLVVDHSVVVEEAGTEGALGRNLAIEFERNRERYEFLRWAQRSVRNFRVVPPGTGIIHQVNMESLARVVWTDDGVLYPDAMVATDSHTPMINALGVLAWGVGGLEAQSAMLGEPIAVPYPVVVGVELRGRLRPGVTATDLALTTTARLRAHGVTDRFVEFFGPGVAELGWAARAAVANMAPEYGATCAYFPYDSQAADYLELTGRSAEHVAVVAAYLKAQGLWRGGMPDYDETVTVDLSEVEPTVAGPQLPHQVQRRSELAKTAPGGPVAIAAITSCTNTANPALMVQAGLLARRAVEAGLRARPWVKTSLAPGSRVVTSYLEAAGLLEPLSSLGFQVAGYGCTTCIGNSGSIDPGLSEPVAVLSGNRNFAGRVHPAVESAYLVSPPMVVVYALTGSLRHDFDATPIGVDHEGEPVFLRDLWPSDEEVAGVVGACVRPELFRANNTELFTGTEEWQALAAEGSTRFPWDPESTYLRRPPYLTGVTREPSRAVGLRDARVLLVLGDDVTTDHISPAGAIPLDSVAGRYLRERGVKPFELNQYAARRSNHEVMLRGAFTNTAVVNELVAGGAYSADLERVLPVREAAVTYGDTPLVIVAGHRYGMGSSRDWAAKAQALLGVRAVLARSFERIHRANLIGMGVLPLEFLEGDHAGNYGLTGASTLSLVGIDRLAVGGLEGALRDAAGMSIPVRLPIRTKTELKYLEHGGTLPAVVRSAL